MATPPDSLNTFYRTYLEPVTTKSYTFCHKKFSDLRKFIQGNLQNQNLFRSTHDWIVNAVKTHNFAVVLFSAAMAGVAAFILISMLPSIPAYAYIGGAVGTVIHITKDEIINQIKTNYEQANYIQLALSSVCVVAAGCLLWKSTLCAVAVVGVGSLFFDKAE